jgi:hypothetical protein
MASASQVVCFFLCLFLLTIDCKLIVSMLYLRLGFINLKTGALFFYLKMELARLEAMHKAVCICDRL